MNEENINKRGRKLRILVGVLDWGLGHATRCIPIIDHLKGLGHTVIIAGSGNSLALLKLEYRDVEFFELPPYNITLSKTRPGFVFRILRQVPRLVGIIREEHRWLTDFVRTHKPDLVISDNRFGLNHEQVPSVYITHQLQIETGFSFLNKLAGKIHGRFFNKFNRIWVPDFESKPNLAGKLSHPDILPQVPVVYTGPLSRLQKSQFNRTDNVLCMISGPEPQRTLFEKKILEQVSGLKIKMTLIRGLPGTERTIDVDENLIVHNHLDSTELARQIQEAGKIICRSGYSTIMDLIKLNGLNAVLVPTPGQSEQEYLARYLEESGWFISAEQESLDLHKQMKKIRHDRTFAIEPLNLGEILNNELRTLCN